MTELIYKIIMVCVPIGVMLMMIGSGIGSMQTEEVLCYDKYGNEIVGQVCIDEGFQKNETGQIVFIIGAILLLLVFIFMWIVIIGG